MARCCIEAELSGLAPETRSQYSWYEARSSPQATMPSRTSAEALGPRKGQSGAVAAARISQSASRS
eukprot:1721842-Lingulodinium_polyedra.AAC.1